jgi:hypothetical protein
MLTFVTPRRFQILVWSSLRFLDKSMEQDHSAFRIDVKQNPRDTILRQSRPYFMYPIAQRPADRHADRPPKLHRFDILTDPLPVTGREHFFQPVANWFTSGICTKKDCGDSFALSFRLQGVRRGSQLRPGFEFSIAK